MALRTGERLSHYEILGSLGVGGMGEVYRARDTRLGREVALKVLPARFADDEPMLLRFEREARMLASLNHVNVAAIHGVDQVDDVCFLVLELVPGETLSARIARGPVPVDEAQVLMTQVARGLAAAHAVGVVHRDLKPANVVVTPDGRAKLLDFGLAKCLEARDREGRSLAGADSGLTSEGMLLGTVDYMSPEQGRGREVDARTDVWAWGCVFYELLTGVRIFPAATAPEKLAAIAADDPNWHVLPAGTPASLRSLLEACLAKKPERRPPDLAEVLALLETGDTVPTGSIAIAVLPFVNQSSNPEDEYFSDGVTDEIQTALGRLPGVCVAARTSSFAFKGRAADVAEVGAKLGVTRVLEGSVRRAGDRVRISVRLVDVKDGFQLWSERFDCKDANLFDLQDRVATSVAEALSPELTGAAEDDPRLVPRRTAVPEAYDRFLQGRFFQDLRGSSLERARFEYEGALGLDPDLAAAHAGLAEVLGLLPYYGSRRPHEEMPKARAAAQRALELDPELAEAHNALGWVHLMYDWDPAAAGREFRAALRLDPRSVQALLWYGGYVLVMAERRIEEGLELCHEAVALDPLSGSAFGQLAVAANMAGRNQEAFDATERGMEHQATHYVLWFQRGVSLYNLGRLEEAREAFERALNLSTMDVWAKSLLAATHATLGDRARAAELQSELEATHAAGYVAPACLSLTPAALGDHDRAFAYLEEGVAQRDGLMRVLPIWTMIAPLLAEERTVALLGRAGLRFG